MQVLCRNPQRHRDLLLLPGLSLDGIDIADEESIRQACAENELVCNLIGVLHNRRRGEFQEIHVDFPRRLAQACKRSDIPFVHLSALGAESTAPSQYLRSKAAGEKIVSSEHQRTVIFRPSLIYGPRDHFLTRFAAMIRILPVVAVPCPSARLTPVYVEDVAAAIADVCISSDGSAFSADKSRDLVGPESYRLIDLVRLIANALELKRWVAPLDPLSSLLSAAIFGALPGKLFTLDNRRSLKSDQSSDALPCPTRITEVLSECLFPVNQQKRLHDCRRKHGR